MAAADLFDCNITNFYCLPLDTLDRSVISRLAALGLKLIALRCAGFNNVDISAAAELGVAVVRVPSYSPTAVGEHAVALMLGLGRQLHRAYNRVREGNFALEGLLGMDFASKTVGIIGTGNIGQVVCRIMKGFQCKVIAYDLYRNAECEAAGVVYVDSADDIYREADIISLHCPLLPSTHHMINDGAIAQMKQGVMIVNTSRGGIIDTQAAIRGLKRGRIGALGIDVYEKEAGFFFDDRSSEVMRDDQFARLLTFPNVLVTGHQAFFTKNALTQIAGTTLGNITNFEKEAPTNLVKP